MNKETLEKIFEYASTVVKTISINKVPKVSACQEVSP